MTEHPSVITLLAPLAHTEATIGVDAKFRRLKFAAGGEILSVPVLSGNSLRGMLRRAAALTILETTGVPAESLDIEMFDLLFAGGALDPGATAGTGVPVDELRQMTRLLPPLGLFGGSVGAHVLPGRVQIDMAVPIVRELEPLTGIPSDLSLYDCLEEVAYTRHDDRHDRDEKSRTQMRYTVECLAAGVRLKHGATLLTDDSLLAGCFWDAVDRVGREYALGGRGAIGHGRFTWTWRPDPDLIDEYRAALREQAGEIRDLLRVPAAVA